MTDDFARKLPFSMIAEQSLLGSVLIDPQSLNEVVEIITADDFYLTEHTQIFTAMRELFLVNKEIDVVTLIDTLVTKGIYDKSGGEDYIRTLYQAVPNSLNVKDYATIVKQKSLLRKLIDACSDISEKAYSEEGDAGQLVDLAESTIFDIAQGRDTKSFRHIRDVIRNVYENLHTMATEGESAQGTKTGFSGIASQTGEDVTVKFEALFEKTTEGTASEILSTARFPSRESVFPEDAKVSIAIPFAPVLMSDVSLCLIHFKSVSFAT